MIKYFFFLLLAIEIKQCSEYEENTLIPGGRKRESNTKDKKINLENRNEGEGTIYCTDKGNLHKVENNKWNKSDGENPKKELKEGINILAFQNNEIKVGKKITENPLTIERRDNEEVITISEDQKFLLMDCIKKESEGNEVTDCKQTQGYLLSEDRKTVYKFIGEEIGVPANDEIDSSINSDDDCKTYPENNIGKIGKLGNSDVIENICIGNKRRLAFGDDNNKYLVLKGEALAGTPFEDAENSVALKVGPNYIIKDQFNSKGRIIEFKKKK